MLEQFERQLDTSEKVRLLLAYAEAQLAAKRGKRTIDTIKRVLELRPEDPAALDVLTRAQEQAQNWTEVISLLQLRSRRAATEDEMFDLLVKTGDVFLENLRDREAAAQTFVMALDVKPDSRNLLTKLMGVYSDAQDWPRLIEIILRIAEMVKDPVAAREVLQHRGHDRAPRARSLRRSRELLRRVALALAGRMPATRSSRAWCSA